MNIIGMNGNFPYMGCLVTDKITGIKRLGLYSGIITGITNEGCRVHFNDGDTSIISFEDFVKYKKLSIKKYNSENFMEEWHARIYLEEIGNVYKYYTTFINNVIDNKLLFNDTKVTLIQNFFEAFEEIYTNYDMFSAIIKNYVKVYNQNSSKYLNKFFLYHIEKILERELYNTKNLDSVFKEKTFKVLDLYCNLIKNKEQSKENNSTTNSKTLNV